MAEIPFYASPEEFAAALQDAINAASLPSNRTACAAAALPDGSWQMTIITSGTNTLPPGDDGIRHSDRAPSPPPWPPSDVAPWLHTDGPDAVAQSIADALAPTPVPPAEYVVVRDRFRGCEYLKRLDDDGGFVVADQVDDARRYWKPEAEVIAEMLGNGWRVARPE